MCSVDGVDLAGVTRDSLRAQIAFVFQENALFDGTIEENLRLANPSATELELRRAAQIAGADEFVRALPDGLATRLGRAGAGLSVGQKQRLAIARALLRDAPILILDEPTSALDPDTERRLLARCAKPRASASCWSSRTGSRPCARPTRSCSCARARSSSAARTTSCSRSRRRLPARYRGAAVRGLRLGAHARPCA